jgi:hypothetical protein
MRAPGLDRPVAQEPDQLLGVTEPWGNAHPGGAGPPHRKDESPPGD